jgi:deazaflavin-dependent oxidoreductase (nitroreductase family)
METTMSESFKFVSEAEQATLDWAARHEAEYLRSGGAHGQFWDFTMNGGHPWTQCLLLETFGRKSGERRIAPLIYGAIGGEFVIIASKGGAPQHPGWYFNITAMEEITIQVGTQAFACTWRELEGDERTRVWDYMAAVYPPYLEYQKTADRLIPVVVFKPLREVPVLSE